MSATRPMLFLDVDGVLNCPGANQEGHEFATLDGTPCWVPRGTRERVARLVEAYDPVWCTAWLGRAHSAWRGILGLDEVPWPYVGYLRYKLPEVIRTAKGRRWAYVDDDLHGYELAGLGWTPDMVDGLLIQPDHGVGLTDEHVDELLAFASNEGQTP